MLVFWQIQIPGWLGKYDCPILGLTKILGNFLQKAIAMLVRACGILGKSDRGIANVGSTSDAHVKQFTEEGTIGEPLFMGQCSMLAAPSSGPV